MTTQHESLFHEEMMAECFRLAEQGAGFVSPNPLVGAVLVRKRTIIARGYHHRFGGIHAEIDCLRHARAAARGASLYVNLEPCSHWGKTPPCVDAIIEAGVREVFIGMKDPNPLVGGKGIAKLRRAQVRVVVGILERDAAHLNRRFIKNITTESPYIHVKVAQSLDGKVGSAGSRPRWISSQSSRRLVHTWRAVEDAVLVGAGTVRADNPMLTVRLARGRDPHVVVVDGRMTSSPSARVFRKRTPRSVFLCVDEKFAARHKARYAAYCKGGATVLTFRARGGILNMRDIFKELYRYNIGSILVEGGSRIFGQLIGSGLVDQLSLFIAPVVLGKGITAFDDTYAGAVSARTPAVDRIHLANVGGDSLLQVYYSH
jgi:diaminohydroxyphosphoribosylaminopyrimidine deaminase/5-amino-6-(5-phosphoribosylamino)uracil reductase